MVYWLQCNYRAEISCKDGQKSVRPKFQQIKQILSWVDQMFKIKRQGESLGLHGSPDLYIHQNRYNNSFQNIGVKNHQKKQSLISKMAEMPRKRLQRNLESTERLVDLESTKKQSQSGTQRKMESYHYSKCIAQTLDHCKK